MRMMMKSMEKLLRPQMAIDHVCSVRRRQVTRRPTLANTADEGRNNKLSIKYQRQITSSNTKTRHMCRLISKKLQFSATLEICSKLRVQQANSIESHKLETITTTAMMLLLHKPWGGLHELGAGTRRCMGAWLGLFCSDARANGLSWASRNAFH